MIRCIAVDDEPLALELINSYIRRTPFLESVGCYSNAFEALQVVQNNPVDLLFLDIQMPEISGLEMASLIDTFRTKVIFTTAFDNYALEGFRVDAVDYLLKPISYTDFLRSAQKVQRLIESKPETDLPGYLVVKSEYRLMKINYSEILYLESLRDYVCIHLDSGHPIKTLSTLKSIESTLPSPPFCRVHRSFIVNLPKVRVVERNCILFERKQIPISEPLRETVMRKLEWR